MAKLIDRPELKAAAASAQQALIDDAGSTTSRAADLTEALANAAVEEALQVVAGEVDVYGSIVDTRLARLRRILDALPGSAPPLTPYEVGAIFRLTPSQGRTLLRTYQARFSKDFRARMKTGVKAAAQAATKKGLGAKKTRYEFVFADTATLDYAADQLRRHGYERTLTTDRPALTITVEAALKVNGKDAKAYLAQ